jgi:hypothetical protein
MFGSDILDVALGMVFVYLLLSLICSAVKELIEQVMKHRPKDLENSLRELLADPDGTGLVQKIYNHGMVFGLFRGAYNPAGSKRNLPSYIPSRNFCLALLNVIAPDSDSSITSLRQSVARIDNQKVKAALQAMLNDAGEDVARFRSNLEGWFNSAMERASGWYKRRAQIVIFVLGFAAAILLNVNSITIAKDLWSNKAKRDVLVSAAQGYLGKQPQGPGTGAATLDPGLKNDLDELQRLGLTFGRKPSGTGPRALLWIYLASIAGWLVTACAISMGAPFWFDMLNKVSLVRSTIKPQETPK